LYVGGIDLAVPPAAPVTRPVAGTPPARVAEPAGTALP
jgi:hypothetical protein